jgi:hypothetical protein
MQNDYIRFSTASMYYLPVFNQHEFFEEPVPCTVWGRWDSRTGVLWLECVTCEGSSFVHNQLSDNDVARFTDALLNELCTKYF